MADAIKLNGPSDSVEAAVRAGFKKIMADNNKQETVEWGFWVVMKVETEGDKKIVKYYFTEPETTRGSGEVELTLPVGQMVRAHCHTHPKRLSTSNFSTGDKASFKKLRAVRPGITWYLLTPQSQIQKGSEEKDFPGGISVSW
jgi:hypothetical protein